MSALPHERRKSGTCREVRVRGSCDRTHLQQDLDGGPFRLLAKPCTTLPKSGTDSKLPAGRAEFPISTIGSEYVVGGQNLPSHIVLYFHAPWALTLELAMTNVKFPRRKFLHLAAGAAAVPAVSRFAWAQEYPNKPVYWIVPYPPGGPTDILARLLGQRLNERLGQPFIVENKPGASGNIGTEMVAKSAPDGYTLLLVAGANAINATLFEKLNFNFIRDLAPVIGIIRSPLVLETNPSKPFKTVNEFVAYAKANPGKVNMASAGIGTPQHMSLELFKMLAGVQVNHIPYRGAAPAVTDLLGGQVDVMFDSLPASLEHIRAGRFRALAVASSSRIDMLPDITPLSEFLPGFEFERMVWRCNASWGFV